ncbi:AraC family transcriptional regulator [Paenibacillus sp. OAE614]
MMQAITLICRQLLGNDHVQGSRNKIEPAIQAMQDEPGINWSVAALASLCGYHPVHFTKLFKHEMGVTPKHFIIRERIKRAKLALLQGEKLELIAERFGFKSLHYFSYQFKQETGLTPTEFRMNGRFGEDG